MSSISEYTKVGTRVRYLNERTGYGTGTVKAINRLGMPMVRWDYCTNPNPLGDLTVTSWSSLEVIDR